MDAEKKYIYYYDKKGGTSAIGGQLYETKLLSLVLFRALQDEDICEFYIGSNIKIGSFDDVCIKWTRDGRDTVVLMQLKHKENKKNPAELNLVTYYESYKKLKNNFSIDNKDILFNGDLANTDFYMVFYTPSSNILNSKININYVSLPWLDKLVCAEVGKGNSFQITDINYFMDLQRNAVIDSLGIAIVENLVKNNENIYATLLDQELFRRYHVVLANKVIDVSSVVNYVNITSSPPNKKTKKSYSCPKPFRNGSFRKEFFNSTDADLKRLRDKIFKKLGKADFENLKSNEFVFKLPHCFGNIDLSETNDERIFALAKYVKNLFNVYSESKIITLDEGFWKKNTLNDGVLGLNGGLESLVGNLLICDDDTHNMLKFNKNLDQRHVNAKKLLEELNNDTRENSMDLYSYRFDIQLIDFTKLSFNGYMYERQLAEEYLSKLWCYIDQAQENEVENILTREIQSKSIKKGELLLFPYIKSVSIFLKFHDAVQKWWMQLDRAEYLDHTCKFYQQSLVQIVDTLETLCEVYVSKKVNSSIEFKKEAKLNISFDENNKIIVLNTKNRFLTATKLYQSFYKNNTDHIFFLDIEYIKETNCYNIMLDELQTSKFYNTVVFIYKEGFQDLLKNTIEKISESKNIIIVTESNLFDNIINYPFGISFGNDENINLMDMQNYKEVLKKYSVKFQNRETTWDRLIDDGSKHLIQSKILTKLLNNVTIEIGKSTISSQYLAKKEYLVQRTIIQGVYEYSIQTLDDIENNVVVVVGDSGMGKSILLNQLSEQTKDSEDENFRKCKWIVNITLRDYCRVFNTWKKNKVKIEKAEALSFLCRAALKCLMNSDSIDNKDKIRKFRLYMEGDKPQFTGFDDDPIGLLEIQLFLNYWNEGNVIIILDGLDEICPFYESEVIRLIYILSKELHEEQCEIQQILPKISSITQQNDSSDKIICCCKFQEKAIRIWITSRYYTSVINALTLALGKDVFELQNLTEDEQRIYLYKYFDKHLNVENEEDISTFCENMKINIKYGNSIFSSLYYFALEYFDQNFNDGCGETEFFSVPLMLELGAEYLIKQIHSNSIGRKRNIGIYDLYSDFFEKKIHDIYYTEKRNIDSTIPENDVYYQNLNKSFNEKYKRLGFQAIFELQDIHRKFPVIVTVDEVTKITETVNDSLTKDDKCGIIEKVIDDLPSFAHFSFAEFYASEYIYDLIQAAIVPNSKQEEIFTDIKTEIKEILKFLRHYDNVIKFLDEKINFKSKIFNGLSIEGNVMTRYVNIESYDGDYYDDLSSERMNALQSNILGTDKKTILNQSESESESDSDLDAADYAQIKTLSFEGAWL